MRRWTRWAVILAVVLVAAGPLAAPGLSQAPRKGVMVVDFADMTGGWSSTREVVTDRVIAKLRDDPNLRVIPRERAQEALREARVESAGYLDGEAAAKVAKTLEADFVVMGQVTAFDQQYTGGCLPIVGCVYTLTAAVTLTGRVLDASAVRVLAEPRSEMRESQTSVSVWVGPWWSSVTVNNFDGQLIGKATAKAVEDLATKVKPFLK